MRLLKIFILTSFLFPFLCNASTNNTFIIVKGNVTYDFSFAELAVNYLETADTAFIYEMAELEATDHILKHAIRFNYDVPTKSKVELVTYLLSPFDEKKETLNQFKRNLQFAKDSIANTDLSQKICLQYLPNGFQFSSKLFFTYGYDLGVVYENNASLNLAHPFYLNNYMEIKYYSIHELHHAGFLMLKNSQMPSLQISTYNEMAKLIEYLTHLEGMGTFAPLDIRIREDAMNSDSDYIAFQDSSMMQDYINEYFEVYHHFKNNPNLILTDEDWGKIGILSDGKRLWYRVGAKIAYEIDGELGRDKLASLIQQPSENFINTYLQLKEIESE
jgi:hypothetical protein